MNTASDHRAAGLVVPDYVPDEAIWPPEGLVAVAELKHMIRLEVAHQLTEAGQIPTSGTCSTTQAMALLHYRDRKSFLAYARLHGLPFERLSARKFRWYVAAIHAHKTRRTVGKVRS